MAQLTQTSITGQNIAKAYAERIGNEILVMPYCKCYTENTLYDDEFDVVNDGGIPTPNAAPTLADAGSGAGPNGTYQHYITFYDQTRDREGNPIQASSSVSVTDNDITVTRTDTNGAANSTVTHWRVYRAKAGGSTYYRLATIAIGTTTYNDSFADSEINANDTLQLDNNPPTSATYGLIKAHKGRMFLAGPYNGIGGTAYDDTFTWSKLNKPHAYPTVNTTKIEPGRNGIIRAMEPSGDRMIFYKDSAIYEFHYVTNPAGPGQGGEGYGKVVNTIRGALNQRCVANVQGVHYVLDQRGIYAFSGGTTVIELAERLARFWPRINWDARERFSAVAGRDRVWFFVALDRDTECKYAFVLDLTAQRAGRGARWYFEKYDQGIRDAVRYNLGVNTSTSLWGMGNETVPLVLTEYLYLGILGVGYRDFVDPQLTASGTATSGTTTTLTDSSATFTRTNEASLTSSVVGAYVRFVPSAASHATLTTAYGDNAYRITACTGTQITFTPAVPTAIAAGATYVIGGIPSAVYKTPLIPLGSARDLKKAGPAAIEFQPGGHNFTIGFGVSKDRREPEDIGVTISEDKYTTTVGQTLQTVDMGGHYEDNNREGFVELPTGERAFHYMQMQFDASGVDKPAIIDALEVRAEEIVG